MTGTPRREPDARGWYNAPVTIDWTATDPEPSSGTASQPDPTVADIDGANVAYTSDHSCDPNGNFATGGIELNLDATAPSASITSPDDGTKVTLGQRVALHFACSTDGPSGVQDCAASDGGRALGDGDLLDTSTAASTPSP